MQLEQLVDMLTDRRVIGARQLATGLDINRAVETVRWWDQHPDVGAGLLVNLLRRREYMAPGPLNRRPLGATTVQFWLNAGCSEWEAALLASLRRPCGQAVDMSPKGTP